ncbi:MAG: hypothetical protein ACP5FL_05345 [Thermoplasmatota archaeon]
MNCLQGEWDRFFGGPGFSVCYFDAVKQTSDGGYILTGQTDSYGSGRADVWLIKTDSHGNELWNKTFGGTGFDAGTSIIQSSDGSYVIAGTKDGFASISAVWLIKTDTNGNEIWSKTYEGDGWTGWCVRETTGGGYIIAGTTRGEPTEVLLIKTDANGNHLWNRTYGDNGVDYAPAVRQTDDGGFILVRTHSDGNYEDQIGDIWLVKTDENGDVLWDKTFAEEGEDISRSVQQTADGGYIIAGIKGQTQDTGSGWLIKTDRNGNKLWDKTFTENGNEGLTAVQQTTDEGYIMTGYMTPYAGASKDLWVIKTDSDGNILWDKNFDKYGSTDEGRSIEQTADGGYIIAGACNMLIWLIKAEPSPANIDIQRISGGLGITIIVTNTGPGDAADIPWSLDVRGSTVMLGQHSEGVIRSLSAGETARIKGLVIGFGPAEMYISVENQLVRKYCNLLGPFVIGVI